MSKEAAALAWLAEHRGLVRFRDDQERGNIVWVMVPVPGSEHDRIVSVLPVQPGEDPVVVAVLAVEEVRVELAATLSRRTLHLVREA